MPRDSPAPDDGPGNVAGHGATSLEHAPPHHGWPLWAHALVASLTALLCLALISGDEPFASWAAPAVAVTTLSPPHDAVPSDSLLQAITPSPWTLRMVRQQYRANLARLREQLNGSLPSPDSSMDIAFASPIYRLNLLDLGVDPTNITKRVAQTVLREYRRLVATSKDRVLGSLQESDKAKDEQAAARLDALRRGVAPPDPAIGGPSDDRAADGGGEEDGDTSLLNDAFFAWQSEQDGWDTMFGGNAEFESVKSFWGRAADHFLRCTGHGPMFEGLPRERQPFLHAWATVHKDCVFHGMHHHGEDVMSGVFYVRMPGQAGRITFYDPRGFHAPFLHRMMVQPREGDIVLFPTSLVHQVTPTEGDSERISIAVNLLGREQSSARGSDAMPTGLLNPGDSVAIADILPDDLYMLD